MFDTADVTERFFDVRLTVNTDSGDLTPLELCVKQPTLALLKRIYSETPLKDYDSERAALLREVLSRNKDGTAIHGEYIDNLTSDQVDALFGAFLLWVRRVRDEKN